ncbi:MAG: hypothetical protein GXO85_03050, partial [Chlorobi bacterium]|nr:hypothetical protein [Chlorobiota bacterium]
MKKLKRIAVAILLILIAVSCSNKEDTAVKNRIDLIQNNKDQKVDVMVNGKLFTSFLYTDQLSVLKKPVLYPIISANGVTITRGFPLNPRPGERTDHPHHIGAWLNYGDVNGLDFWGNSDAIPPERAEEMGTIRLEKIKKLESGNGKAELSVICDWMNSEKKVLLKENTDFIFSVEKDKRIIDRITTLTA